MRRRVVVPSKQKPNLTPSDLQIIHEQQIELDLSKKNITDQYIKELAEFLSKNPQITTINLEDSSITEKAFKAIFSVLTIENMRCRGIYCVFDIKGILKDQNPYARLQHGIDAGVTVTPPRLKSLCLFATKEQAVSLNLLDLPSELQADLNKIK